jgi:SapC
MHFGTANKLGLVDVLREQCSLVELPTFALRTRLSEAELRRRILHHSALLPCVIILKTTSAKNETVPMKIDPPPGYEKVTPLLKTHRVLLPRAEETPAIFRRLHVLPLSLAEFEPACRDYPIVFVSNDGGVTFNAVVVLGMQVKQNLFILTDGMWDRRAYLPAYVRRYPFCISRGAAGESQEERTVCVEETALHESGESLYDADGRPLPQWTILEKMIFDYEQDLVRCESMCRLLAGMKLLEPFTMKAEIDGFTMQLDGMHRVARAALQALPPNQLSQLMSAGAMEKIYSHLLSLENFRRLLNRRSFFAIRPPNGQTDLN